MRLSPGTPACILRQPALKPHARSTPADPHNTARDGTVTVCTQAAAAATTQLPAVRSGSSQAAGAPGAGELGVPAAHKGLGAVEDHAVARLALLLELALLDGLRRLGRLALVCSTAQQRQTGGAFGGAQRRTAEMLIRYNWLFLKAASLLLGAAEADRGAGWLGTEVPRRQGGGCSAMHRRRSMKVPPKPLGLPLAMPRPMGAAGASATAWAAALNTCLLPSPPPPRRCAGLTLRMVSTARRLAAAPGPPPHAGWHPRPTPTRLRTRRRHWDDAPGQPRAKEGCAGACRSHEAPPPRGKACRSTPRRQSSVPCMCGLMAW